MISGGTKARRHEGTEGLVRGRRARVFNVAWCCLLAVSYGCGMELGGSQTEPINPFVDLPEVAIDGAAHDIQNSIIPLGSLEGGDVINVLVESDAVASVLILGEDDVFTEAGVVVGGGPANEAFDYRVPATGRNFVFVQFQAAAETSELVGTITLSSGDDAFAPPSSQPFVISFEEGYLSDPGMFDPESGTDDEQALLESISDQVREQVLDRLRTIFEGTPIQIVDERDGLPPAPFSRVTFSPERVVAGERESALDSALPLITTDDACLDRVIFGEILPRGASQDTGNRVLDDEAKVYVGSFQGRGAACRTAAVTSVNNIVLGLSQTGAHEIGHLVGLFHVTLVDIMDRSPSLSFQRELTFARGQILTEELVESGDGSTDAVTTILTTVIQDPDRYFNSIFQP